MSLSESVIKIVQDQFPPEEQSKILELLSAYGMEPHEREVERVLKDLLLLAKRDNMDIPSLVKEAKRDYRNILFWAEYPDQSKLDTPEKIKEFNRMLEKFGADWRVPEK